MRVYLAARRLGAGGSSRVLVEVSTENTVNAVRVLLRHTLNMPRGEPLHIHVQSADARFAHFPHGFASILHGVANPYQLLGEWMLGAGMRAPEHLARINVELEEASNSSGRVSVTSFGESHDESNDEETRVE